MSGNYLTPLSSWDSAALAGIVWLVIEELPPLIALGLAILIALLTWASVSATPRWKPPQIKRTG